MDGRFQSTAVGCRRSIGGLRVRVLIFVLALCLIGASAPSRSRYYSAEEPLPQSAVYVGDLSGTFHAVNARDGKALWTFKTESEIKSSPVIVGDKVLIGSYDGNLYCLSTRNGSVVWKFKTNSYVHGTPSIVSGIAY